MHDSSDVESYGRGHRTFDCPWCGAISGIDPSHLGEHFDCPECHKQTKLTPQNTRPGHITEPPPDAPRPAETEGAGGGPKKPLHEVSAWETYGRGARTFDCPWCGAISSIDPSHLGEHFDCPECHKRTKLTADNTRSAPPTEPPPDAPHHVEKPSRMPLVLGALGVLVVAVVVIAVTAGQGETPAQTPGAGNERAALPGPAEPAPEEAVPSGEGEVATPAPDDPTPGEGPGEETAPPEGTSEEVAPPPPEETPPPDPVETARARVAKAEEALQAWEAGHPGEMKIIQLRLLGNAMRATVEGELEKIGDGEATPQQARAFNKALRAYIAADPERVALAEYLVRHLSRDGLKPSGVETWGDLNFYAPRIRGVFMEICAAWGGPAIAAHENLVKELQEARFALQALMDAE